MDTIFALSTAAGRAGIAVVRVSGPRVQEVLISAVGLVPEPRLATLCVFKDAEGVAIDKCLVLFFPGPRSFTGEDVVEFHVHGGHATVNAVLGFLGKCTGLRLAEAGEFTRRALENDRMDLSEVEGLADLIDAETEAQRLQAQRLMEGSFRRTVQKWRGDLLQVLSLLAASIDFADEDIPEGILHGVANTLNEMCTSLENEIEGAKVAERVRSGFEVAIIGSPNAGKSTLINYLAGREASITSEIAGTTRDIIEIKLSVDGLPVVFLDTAGLHSSDDDLESLGIDRALRRARMADMRVFVGDIDEDFSDLRQSEDLFFTAKADLSGDPGGISGATGMGVDVLLEGVSEVLMKKASCIGSAVRFRHQETLANALFCLRNARNFAESGDVELSSEEIRQANLIMSSALGFVGIEEVLGEVFAGFCIGK